MEIFVHGKTGLIILNRSESLNALSDELMDELGHALDSFDSHDDISVMIITGNEKAFAAGADISKMKDKSYMDAYLGNFISRNWEKVTQCRKPIIAAVAGYALGGGCELAMMCDFIIAAENAKFGQPEIKLGVIPGAGGTQRLTRIVGKSKAMEMCLTGRLMNSSEAETAGLVSRVVSTDKLLEEALSTAEIICSMSKPSVLMAKAAVNKAYETTLTEGIANERLMFQSLFSTYDQKEGMSAFLEKRQPEWKNK